MNNSIYERRSIRKYQDKQVEKELIEKIIDAGRMAPSAKNRQPWQYIVLGGKSKADFLEQMRKGVFREENGGAMLPGFGKWHCRCKKYMENYGDSTRADCCS